MRRRRVGTALQKSLSHFVQKPNPRRSHIPILYLYGREAAVFPSSVELGEQEAWFGSAKPSELVTQSELHFPRAVDCAGDSAKGAIGWIGIGSAEDVAVKRVDQVRLQRQTV